MSIDILAYDTEQSENLEVLLFNEIVVIFLPQHFLRQFVNKNLIYEIFHQKLIIFEELFQKFEMARLIFD